MSPNHSPQENLFMANPFDIFEVDTKEAVRWLGAAATLTEAQATIRRHGVDLSARYIVVDRRTGKKMAVDHAGLEATSHAAGAGRGTGEPGLGRAANG
jgi:hypothetical protein